MNIPLVDLKRQINSIRQEIDLAIKEVIDNTAFIGGKFLERFEKNFAKFCEIPYAAGVSSGTSALFLALKSIGIKQDDEVITTPATFIATAEAIVNAGAKVKFVDINPETYNIDHNAIEKAITNKTKAIIAVDLYGLMANMPELKKIAEKYNIYLIEDAAQAHGAKISSKGPGFYSDIATFSFYPGKNLGAFGDAGAVISKNPELINKIKILRNHGRKEKYIHNVIGDNFRMDPIQANILNVKLNYITEWNKKRNIIAKKYKELLKNLDIQLPHIPDNYEHVFHIFAIKVKNRDKILSYLKEKQIFAGIHYPVPLHLQPAFKFLGYKKGDFPITEELFENELSLPISPELTDNEIEYVVESLKNAINI